MLSRLLKVDLVMKAMKLLFIKFVVDEVATVVVLEVVALNQISDCSSYHLKRFNDKSEIKLI